MHLIYNRNRLFKRQKILSPQITSKGTYTKSFYQTQKCTKEFDIPEMPDNKQTFMSLLVANQSQILTYILYLNPNRADADDILQETLTEMWNKFDGYQEGTNFFAWATKIAKFKCLSHKKRNKNHKLHFSPDLTELIESEMKSHSKNNNLSDQIDALKKCLNKLTDKENKYLFLRYNSNLTYQGIAEEFGISMQAVYKAIGIIQYRLANCVRILLQSK